MIKIFPGMYGKVAKVEITDAACTRVITTYIKCADGTYTRVSNGITEAHLKQYLHRLPPTFADLDKLFEENDLSDLDK